ncbi:serine hydrolase domain-containing protein [Promicromonospora sukumoe]|uniref:serine hydrolase domain-containing protein n=1 Tax=Promicromonospora sukumoe TaxID=88382 RepID=UPI00364BF874
MTFDLTHWQTRLDRLAATHHVPGATLAVLADGRVHELATGRLHTGTGVETTTDSLFLTGSVAKVYTATAIARLADEGRLDLDAPVRAVLPDFTVADPEASRTITPRQLLSHTSGLTCDFNYDGGRGDDCIERFVAAAATIALDCPPGMVSYSSVGYVVLGRIIEVLTGTTWDQALKDLLFTPLGMTHSVTLPEEALAFRTAMSHLGEPGAYPEPAPAWDLMPRVAGPYGRVITTAADMVRLARMHLDGGTTTDGSRVLSARAVEEMQQRVTGVPDRWTVSADGWGLGWTLYDWDGIPGYGHDGAAVGQYAYLRVVPHAGVAVALLTNGGSARQLYGDLLPELLAELAGVTMPGPFEPAAEPPVVDLAPYVGVYRREGVRITVSARDGQGHLRYEFVDDMAGLSPAIEGRLVPLSSTVFAATGAGPSFSEGYMPVVFAALPDGRGCCYIGMRCAPRIG